MARRRGRTASAPRPSGGGSPAPTSRIAPRTSSRLSRAVRRPRAKPGLMLRTKLRFTLLATTMLGFLLARLNHAALKDWLLREPVLARVIILSGLCLPVVVVTALHRRNRLP